MCFSPGTFLDLISKIIISVSVQLEMALYIIMEVGFPPFYFQCFSTRHMRSVLWNLLKRSPRTRLVEEIAIAQCDQLSQTLQPLRVFQREFCR